MKKISFWEAVATIVGSTVGAGILAIPYSIAKVGFAPGLILMISLAVASTLLNLMMAEVSLKTDKLHQLPGFAGIYMGGAIKNIAFINSILASFGALLAYIIGEGQVLSGIFGGGSFLWSLIFVAFGAVAILLGINVIKKLVVVMVLCVVGILILLGGHAFEFVRIHNLNTFNPQNWIIPYGVLLFAFHGTLGVLEARKELIGQEKLLKKVIITAGGVILAIYVVFTFLTLGVTGVATTQVATIGLGKHLGPILGLIGNALAAFTMGTCFITIGYGVRLMLQYDYGKSKVLSWLIVISIPLLMFLSGIRSFIEVVKIIGGIVIGVNSIILVVTYWNARVFGRRHAEFSIGPLHIAGYLLMVLFLLGALVTLASI